MSSGNLATRWSHYGPEFQSILRIVAALLFILFGMTKLFAIPYGIPPLGHAAIPLTQPWFAGVIECFGGALLLLGLFTRPVAFLCSGEMAVAYFQVHAHMGFWPMKNGGMPAVLYCFLWLYFSSAGAGAWSLDALRQPRPQEGRKFESTMRGPTSKLPGTTSAR
jgi:putative oxidoreductase